MKKAEKQIDSPAENLMDPAEQPEMLKCFAFVQEQLIAQVQPNHFDLRAQTRTI